MAYNNYFSPYQFPQQQRQPNLIIALIQGGKTGAESYLLAPNTIAYLFDNEKNQFFIKQADAFGVPMPIRSFSFSEQEEKKEAPTVEYATKADIEKLKEQIASLKGDKDE